MISTENIPEDALIGSDGMTIAEIKDKKLHDHFANNLRGSIFYMSIEDRYFIKAELSLIDELKKQYNKV